jgi:hypothetical protein
LPYIVISALLFTSTQSFSVGPSNSFTVISLLLSKDRLQVLPDRLPSSML